MKSEQVGARVKEMRKALGMKQDELSSILDIGKRIQLPLPHYRVSLR